MLLFYLSVDIINQCDGMIISHQRSSSLINLEMLLAHVWVADASQRHKSLLHSLNINFENQLLWFPIQISTEGWTVVAPAGSPT